MLLEAAPLPPSSPPPRPCIICCTARKVDTPILILLAHKFCLYLTHHHHHRHHHKILVDKMDTFTTACLAPTTPAKGSLESIGSVRAMHERANAETADNSDFGKFQKESDPHADHIYQM